MAQLVFAWRVGWYTCYTSGEMTLPASSEMPTGTSQAYGALGTFQEGSAEGDQMPLVVIGR